jgi:hypothetical protein
LTLLLSLWAPLASAQAFVISDIRVEGLQRISAGSVFAALPVAVGDTIDERAIRAAARSLFSTGNFDDIRIGRDGNVLVVVVAERPSISEINIEGNKAIETEALLDGLKGAGLAVGQVFQRSTLEGMQLELQRQYVQQGRYDANIETEVLPEPRNRVTINIDVDEGQRRGSHRPVRTQDHRLAFVLHQRRQVFQREAYRRSGNPVLPLPGPRLPAVQHRFDPGVCVPGQESSLYHRQRHRGGEVHREFGGPFW